MAKARVKPGRNPLWGDETAAAATEREVREAGPSDPGPGLTGGETPPEDPEPVPTPDPGARPAPPAYP